MTLFSVRGRDVCVQSRFYGVFLRPSSISTGCRRLKEDSKHALSAQLLYSMKSNYWQLFFLLVLFVNLYAVQYSFTDDTHSYFIKLHGK